MDTHVYSLIENDFTPYSPALTLHDDKDKDTHLGTSHGSVDEESLLCVMTYADDSDGYDRIRLLIQDLPRYPVEALEEFYWTSSNVSSISTDFSKRFTEDDVKRSMSSVEYDLRRHALWSSLHSKLITTMSIERSDHINVLSTDGKDKKRTLLNNRGPSLRAGVQDGMNRVNRVIADADKLKDYRSQLTSTLTTAGTTPDENGFEEKGRMLSTTTRSTLDVCSFTSLLDDVKYEQDKILFSLTQYSDRTRFPDRELARSCMALLVAQLSRSPVVSLNMEKDGILTTANTVSDTPSSTSTTRGHSVYLPTKSASDVFKMSLQSRPGLYNMRSRSIMESKTISDSLDSMPYTKMGVRGNGQVVGVADTGIDQVSMLYPYLVVALTMMIMVMMSILIKPPLHVPNHILMSFSLRLYELTIYYFYILFSSSEPLHVQRQ